MSLSKSRAKPAIEATRQEKNEEARRDRQPHTPIHEFRQPLLSNLLSLTTNPPHSTQIHPLLSKLLSGPRVRGRSRPTSWRSFNRRGRRDAWFCRAGLEEGALLTSRRWWLFRGLNVLDPLGWGRGESTCPRGIPVSTLLIRGIPSLHLSS